MQYQMDHQMPYNDIIRSLSTLTKKNINPASLFDNPALLDEIMWQLLVIYFDMPQRNFKKMYYLKLLNYASDELNLGIPFQVTDFGEKRDRRKWLSFLSYFLPCLEDISKNSQNLWIFEQVKEAKGRYTVLQDTLDSKEREVESSRNAQRERCMALQNLSRNLDDKRSTNQQTAAAISALEDELRSAMVSSEEATKKINLLNPKLKTLESDYAEACSLQIKDCDTLPDSIAELKQSLEVVEAEIHHLFETRTSVVEQTTQFQQYESLLDVQLKNAQDQTYVEMEKFAALQKQLKNLQTQMDKLISQLNRTQTEADECQQQIVNCGNQLMRKKLLLHNKSKALEADQKKRSKELDALRSDIEAGRSRLVQLRQHQSAVEDQINLEKEAKKKLSQKLPIVDRISQSLSQLYLEWTPNNN